MHSKYRRLRLRNTRNPTKHIVCHSGSEGPKHDPYGYVEYFGYDAEGYKVKLHLGLDNWLQIGGNAKIHFYDLNQNLMTEKGERKAYAILTKRFEREVGTTVVMVDKYLASLNSDPMGCLADYE